MSTFRPAFDYMIRNEDYNLIGKVTDEPNGGKARFGINSMFHPETIPDEFYTMDRDRALEYAQSIYMKEYWAGRGFALIADQRLATKLFDMAVNMGNGGELEVLQTALGVEVTHHMDAVTVSALNEAKPEFMGVLVKELRAHYQRLCDKNPTKYSKYLTGWLNRASKLPD